MSQPRASSLHRLTSVASWGPTLAVLLALAACPPGVLAPVDPDHDPATGDADDTDGGIETVPSEEGPWLRQETQAPGSVTFTEILYHPPSDEALEWLELHNPMVLDMDLSGWSLAGGVRFEFDEGTILPAGGYLVVAADPSLLAEETGLDELLGPYDGQLANDGERLELWNGYGRLIDTVEYGDDDPWPVRADGSGLSLAKVDADAASDRAENWAVSVELGGTPGASNLLDPLLPPTTLELVPEDASWSYDLSGDYPAEDWVEPGYDDSAWESGEAVFYAGEQQELYEATAWATADNYFSLYLGQADGNDLRLVGEDSDGSWSSVEDFELELTPRDHLFIAAWELTGDATSTQMTIAEVELPDDSVGTDSERFEWVLGPADDNPGGLPANPPPSEEEIFALIQDADADGDWDLPAVERDRGSSPWGGSVSGSFTDAAKFVWADTFDADSVANQENTYALFRSVEPLVAPQGNLELGEIPTTITFRTDFDFDADPAATELTLACTLDDGAVFYLNGVEVHRENMPEGSVDAATLASAPVGDAVEVYIELSSDALEQGLNVLAVELHQAESDDEDMAFGCALGATIWPDTVEPALVLNEIAAGGEAPFWVELANVSQSSVETEGLVLASSEGDELLLSAGALGPGDLLVLDDLDITPDQGELLFLYADDGDSLLDAVRVGEGLRARLDDGGPWRFPSEATPGDPNLVELSEDVVIHEIMYHRAPLSQDGEAVTARSEEWIELYNRGEDEVDLGGWQLVDAVAYLFPDGTVLAPDGYLVVSNDADALRSDHPGIAVVGEFSGRLANGGDRVLLLDAYGNPADELRYFDGGRWPAAADGGGSSLELRDPWADNTAAEAWAASDESERTRWVSYSYQGLAESSAVGPDGVWEELVLGLLDAGEVLIDDLSVVRDPDTEAAEQLWNGTFDEDSERWRLLGNHRHSEVVPDPEDASNPVLRLVATGGTEHMHNHAETTLREDIRAQEYEISFRARWVAGSNQLHTRLYFERLARTTLVEQPELSGTPGEPNATGEDNIGPTFADLGQDVAVPKPYEPVLVSVTVDDPDGVARVTLWSSVDGAPFEDRAMDELEPGRWQAELDGQAAGSLVQLYVEAEDELGLGSSFPAAGPDSRAMYAVDDGEASTTGLHTLRILMTEADADWLHEDVNLMSNDRVGATVVYQEAELFYDVGVRIKGSERGRPTEDRLGYALRFRDDQPFRGHHASVLIDRSEGVGFGQREVLLNLVATRAGTVFGEYNDLIRLVAPRSAYTGSAELQLDRFSDLVLASQFEDGDSGKRFEYELVYYPTTTDDGTAEGLKLPQPDTVVGTSITDLGDDKEAYRWNFLVKNNEREDDYDGLIAFCQVFGLSQQELLELADEVIDPDQWLRAFALATLSGATDQYGGSGAQHNAQFYLRPEDGRVLYFPHDLDYFGSSTMAVVNNGDLDQLLDDPGYARSYYGHLQDIVGRAYSSAYLGPWCDQLGDLLPGQDFEANCQFIDDRADWVMNRSSDAVTVRYPQVDFQITTAGGADFELASTEVVLEGEAWLDVRSVALAGGGEPLEIVWVGATSWQVVLALEEGPNELSLEAYDHHGEIVGTDSITVTSSV